MSEKSEHVLTSSISILQERALDLIASRSDGVFQSDLRRLLEHRQQQVLEDDIQDAETPASSIERRSLPAALI